MATIYRFIVEQKAINGGGRKSSSETSGISKKATAKKGKYVSIISGEKGGVEHNRYMRAVNPVLNKITGGWYEKAVRVGRAGLGLVQKNTETGAIRLSGVSIAIIIAFTIQMLMKWHNKETQLAEQKNKQNFKMLENGFGQINGAYQVSVNMWNGRMTYNQNK